MIIPIPNASYLISVRIDDIFNPFSIHYDYTFFIGKFFLSVPKFSSVFLKTFFCKITVNPRIGPP